MTSTPGGIKLLLLSATMFITTTNVVYVQVDRDKVAALKEHLARLGIVASIAPRTRLVTHLDVSRAQIDAAIAAFRDFPGGAG